MVLEGKIKSAIFENPNNTGSMASILMALEYLARFILRWLGYQI